MAHHSEKRMFRSDHEFRKRIRTVMLKEQHEKCRAWRENDKIHWLDGDMNERTACFWHYMPRRKVI